MQTCTLVGKLPIVKFKTVSLVRATYDPDSMNSVPVDCPVWTLLASEALSDQIPTQVSYVTDSAQEAARRPGSRFRRQVSVCK